MKSILILSVTSDIGKFLAHQYLSRGWQVIGTYRNSRHLKGISPSIELIPCDVTDPQDVQRLAKQLKTKRIRWKRLISCVGNLLPAQAFFKSDFKQWQASVDVNALGQLHLVHAVHPLRAVNAQVVFFAGGGVNNAVTDITAYTASKMLLTKMVEYLDAENKDMSFIIIGPGWTKTKIHDDILKAKKVSEFKLKQTKHDLDHKPSTSLDYIDGYIHWLCSLPKKTVSGRNFSVTHDAWQGAKGLKLEKALNADNNMYKLRRYKNDF